MPLFAPGLDPALVDETVQLARIMFPIVVLLGLTGLVAAILQAGGRFGPTAFAPVLWNMVIIVGLVAVTPFVPEDDRDHGLRGGDRGRARSPSCCTCCPSLRGHGPVPAVVRLRATRMVRRVLVLMLPVTLGAGAHQRQPDGRHGLRHAGQRPGAARDRRRLPPLPAAPGRVQRRHLDRAVPDHLAPGRPRRRARACAARSPRACGRSSSCCCRRRRSCWCWPSRWCGWCSSAASSTPDSTALTSGALFFFAIGLAFNGASLLVIRAFFSLQMPLDCRPRWRRSGWC